ncbi:hypothetical protein SAMN04488074_104312 [Lentzea albidocapillata subsp. violacea]|uniref:DUF2017 domain-containing protein n=1 Tax=Lentzea albidocapillata subsp. violacea TaxID=128104 RepID=A0A1G8ZEJ3_9PSEU|nr:hypothetical protein [Lentzea albidocapillata]SDK12600.1 hypothetical protein SAMN04488074_104312 [Lentzea albidocapillata subsp. violacea]
MEEPAYVVVSMGDGLLVRASDAFVASTLTVLAELLDLLEDGVVPRERKKRFWRAPAAETLMRQMFPDASRSAAEADAFWARHRDVLTDPKPARRVRKRCAEPTPWLLGFEEVDDWLTTFAQLRGLHLTWTRATTTTAMAYSGVQQALVTALEPRTATGWPAG